MAPFNKFEGGDHTHHHNYPSQRELELETISEEITIKVRPKQKTYLEERANKEGIPLRTMLRRIIFKYLTIEPKLHELDNTLDDIL